MAFKAVKLLLDLFAAFVKVSCLAFGGGPAIVALLQSEVESHEWMTEPEYRRALIAGYMLPAAIALKMAVAVGRRVAGTLGVVSALLGTIVPSVLLMLLLERFMDVHKESPHVRGFLRGANPVVVGILASAVWTIGRPSVTDWRTALIAVGTLFVVAGLKWRPLYAILVGGGIGWAFLR